jgi:hypothetical protein
LRWQGDVARGHESAYRAAIKNHRPDIGEESYIGQLVGLEQRLADAHVQHEPLIRKREAEWSPVVRHGRSRADVQTGCPGSSASGDPAREGEHHRYREGAEVS